MKNKMTYLLFAISCLMLWAVSAIAQTTNGAPATEGYTPEGPTNMTKLWELGIAIVSPFIVMGIKRFAPSIPTVLLPLSTPIIGVALGALTNWLTSAHLAWVDMAQAGALAVFIRESWDQALKSRQTSSSL